MKKLFNKRGMTYVEMLVALVLLSLIVVSFTPMLLSSYETIYNAGEKIQDNYGSREEIEEGLARRDSSTIVDMNLDLRVNANALFDQISVNGHKVVSTFANVFETVFGQVRPRVEIVSPNRVYDNQPSHDIILQTIGLEYSQIRFGKFSEKYTVEDDGDSPLPKGEIFIQVTMPNKTKGSETNTGSSSGSDGSNEEPVYDYGTILNVSLASEDSNNFQSTSDTIKFSNKNNNGRFKLRVGNQALDFTYSPVQVKVYYTNPRGKLRFVTDYLYIEPATMIFAGETTAGIDYYTSPGVEEIDTSTDVNNKTSEFQLVATPRQMRTTNSPFLINAGQFTAPMGAPGDRKVDSAGYGVRINAVKWIDNDESAGIKPYYIMVGTDGAIYRMYNFSSNKTDLYEYATGHKTFDTSSGYFGGSQPYIDNIFNISNGARIYPSFWGGDFSHIFEYSSAYKRLAYGSSANHDYDESWVTSETVKSGNKNYRAGLKGDDSFNVMSPMAQFAYYYNGEASLHKFVFKNAKSLSYALTERGWPLRLIGVVGPAKPDKDYYEDFAALWGNPINNSQVTVNIRTDTIYDNSSEVLAFHYKHKNEDQQSDYVYAQLRLKSLGSYDITGTPGGVNYLINEGVRKNHGSFIDPEYGDYGETSSMTKIANVRGGTGQSDKSDRLNGAAGDVNITDVIYIPGTGSTLGSTFYVGSVHAYANMIQTDKISSNAYKGDKLSGNEGKYYRNKSGSFESNDCSYPVGAVSDYLILSNKDGTATYITKYNDRDYSRMSDTDRISHFSNCVGYINANDANITKENATSYDSNKNFAVNHDPKSNATFFLPNGSQTWSYMYLGDVSFTFGYASNREKVYTNITYDGKIEYTRSFERLYWRSHYGLDSKYYEENGEKTFKEIESNQDIYSSKLGFHTANRAVSDGNGGLQTSQTYLNKVDNDYYNVWFPGEMYNLNKVVSKDGVTVAVGFAVSGSTFQNAYSEDNSVTSTALGGIFNDGVLSAMVEGQDKALVNLLYFKDNDTFDGSSLYSTDTELKNQSLNNAAYSAYGAIGYGTHKRDSVQFVAVDLIVEAQNTNIRSSTSQVSYYAYYGDNKGRVFRSLVATGTGTDTGTVDPETGDPIVSKAIETVPFIKDTTYAGTDGKYTVGGVEVPYAGMEEIKVNGKSLSTYFSRIGTIDAKDDMIIITGEAATKGAVETIIIGIRNPDAQPNEDPWTYYAVQNGTFTGIINDACIVGGYYYIVGKGGGTSKPWIAAVSLDTLKKVAQSNNKVIKAASAGNVSTSKDELLWIETNLEMYAIAGRDTN